MEGFDRSQRGRAKYGVFVICFEWAERVNGLRWSGLIGGVHGSWACLVLVGWICDG